MKYYLKCLGCGESYGAKYRKQTCERCGGLLEVIYTGRLRGFSHAIGFWKYESVLPDSNYRHYELGSTRLIRGHDSDNLLLKLEIENPTRSFKDRGSVVEVSKAVEYGYDRLACASTGNMAYSIAYYSRLTGVHAKLFISRDANKDKIRDIEETGDTDIVHVNGDFTKAQGLAEEYANKRGAFLAGDYCYRKEGQRTIAYEIVEQAPDVTHIIVPVGNATLISGIFKGLKEMKLAGRIRRLPVLIGVQAKGSDPLVRAFKSGGGIKYLATKTAADAIAVGLPTFGEQALKAMKETKGFAMSVTDGEMEKEQKRFYDEYGLVAELAGVASIAAFRRLKKIRGCKFAAIISGGNV